MENKFQSTLGGRVALSDSEGHIETTSCNQTKYILKDVGLDTPRHFDFPRHTLASLSAALLDQRTAL